MMYTKVIGVRFLIAFFCFILEHSIENGFENVIRVNKEEKNAKFCLKHMLKKKVLLKSNLKKL